MVPDPSESARFAGSGGREAKGDDRIPTCCPCCNPSPRRSSAWRPSGGAAPDLRAADAFVWHSQGEWLEPVRSVNRVDIDLLRGIDRARDILIDNTRRFAAGLPANNALLWGARGTGKSSLVKAVHAAVNAENGGKKDRQIALVEIHREDLASLPSLLKMLRESKRRCLLFCDDLSFDSCGYQLQVAEGGAGGRYRGPAGQCAVLCHLEPAPPDAAGDDRQRALDGDQPVGGGRGKGVAVRPLRPVARLPQLRPGHLLRDHRGLCEALRPLPFPTRHCAPRRSNGR